MLKKGVFSTIIGLSLVLCSCSLAIAQQTGNLGARENLEGDASKKMGWAGTRSGISSPLDIPLVLAGNFGELRADHFHTGLDFKTQGQEGFPVLAATDGVIARVKISPYGYGRALYLSGPQGVTTVYAHLQRFSSRLEQWSREEQYKKKQFALDARPTQSIVFEQGDTIGWSGNSGGSGGPHLHFEVRETASQRPINPMFWEFLVSDTTLPEIQGVWLLPQLNGTINGRSRPVKLEREGVVVAQGGFRVAIDALDRLDDAYNRCGIYKAELRWDEELVFSWELDTLDFSVNRDMNAHAYYPAWQSSGEQTHRMHRLPGNRLPVYSASATSDHISCDSIERCERILSVEVWDVHGNSAQKSWIIVSKPAAIKDAAQGMSQQLHSWRKTHRMVADGLEVYCPSSAFYDDFVLGLDRASGTEFRVGNSSVPLSKSVEVSVSLKSEWREFENNGCTDRTAVRWVDESGDAQSWYSGQCEDSAFVFSTRQLGQYQLAIDTVAPTIGPHRRHMTDQDSMLLVRNADELRFNLSDEGVGISRFEAALDGEWLLLRWDPKRERIWYELEDRRHEANEKHQLSIVAFDEVGNRAEWLGWVKFAP